MNKRIPFLIAGFIALGVSFAQIRPKNVVDEVIWVVGDSPILLSDVEGFRVNAEAGGQTFKDPYA
ncbi:MAG: peptidylprolyl isomerase, partial [Trueperella pyogenes]|nr:peptidylprolyl isomerase [Trueperella pyogenes]